MNLFLVTILLVPFLSLAFMLLGAALLSLMPKTFERSGLFYLAPALGISIVLILASTIGKYFPFEKSPLVPITIAFIALIFWNKKKYFSQISFSSVIKYVSFALFCGSSLLIQIYICDGYNSHNDAFTYLVHGEWLQTNIFGDKITQSNISPLNTQILIYQNLGLRMGASYLLAFIAGITQAKSVYDVYPPLVISILAAGSFALGYPLKKYLDLHKPIIKVGILLIPSLLSGGYLFAANYGFLPQLVGICLFSACIFLLSSIDLQKRIEIYGQQIISIILAIFISGACYAYSEISPVLFLSISIIFLTYLITKKDKKAIFYLAVNITVYTVILLNVELLRMYEALKSQSSSVVGGAVDWKLIGFIMHSFGLHGGAWDVNQWAHTNNIKSSQIIQSIFFLAIVFVTNLIEENKKRNLNTFMIFVTCVVLVILFMYFRYLVENPWEIGVGQSWSQFKITDWAFPFMVFFSLRAILLLIKVEYLKYIFPIIFIFLIKFSFQASIDRSYQFYDGFNSDIKLRETYLNLVDEVERTCKDKPLYLAIKDNEHKVKQSLLFFLYKKNPTSNWQSDGYISQFYKENQDYPYADDCILEMADGQYTDDDAIIVKPFKIGSLSIKNIPNKLTQSKYAKESDGSNYWYWVDNVIDFELNMKTLKDAASIQLDFTIIPVDNCAIITTLFDNNGQKFKSVNEVQHGIENNIFINSSKKFIGPVELQISSNCPQIRLGKGDDRVVKFMIKNLKTTLEN